MAESTTVRTVVQEEARPIRRDRIDALLKAYPTPQAILAEDGLLKQLSKAVIERGLETELDPHLGDPKPRRAGTATGNRRNGHSQKTRKGAQGQVESAVPRDRQGRFEPQRVQQGQTRLQGFDDKSLARSARGRTTRDIQAQVQERSGVEVSPTVIATVTEAGMDEGRQWQARPLETRDPLVYFACLVVTVRENQRGIKKARQLALGITRPGYQERLGLGRAQHEGAKVWLAVLTELQNRGMKDRFLACVAGRPGWPEAIEAVYPQTRVQLCLVQLGRNSLRSGSQQPMQEVATELKASYSASTQADAELHVPVFAEQWDARAASMSKSWRAHWARIIPLGAFPADMRQVSSPTTASASLPMTLRKGPRTHRIFPSAAAVDTVSYRAVRHLSKKWTMPLHDWKPALNRFAVECAARFPQ